MHKKHLLLLSLLFVLFLSIGNAQKDSTKQINPNKFNHFSMGLQICQYQKDFGIGLHITSPYIAKRIAFRMRGNLQFFDPLWSTYGNLTLSVVTRQEVIKNKLYVYGEGGGGMIFANSSVSVERIYGGGFGLFGVEFTPSIMGFYFEMGGMGTAARDAANRPYSNGFILHTGFRVYL